MKHWIQRSLEPADRTPQPLHIHHGGVLGVKSWINSHRSYFRKGHHFWGEESSLLPQRKQVGLRELKRLGGGRWDKDSTPLGLLTGPALRIPCGEGTTCLLLTKNYLPQAWGYDSRSCQQSPLMGQHCVNN